MLMPVAPAIPVVPVPTKPVSVPKLEMLCTLTDPSGIAPVSQVRMRNGCSLWPNSSDCASRRIARDRRAARIGTTEPSRNSGQSAYRWATNIRADLTIFSLCDRNISWHAECIILRHVFPFPRSTGYDEHGSSDGPQVRSPTSSPAVRAKSRWRNRSACRASPPWESARSSAARHLRFDRNGRRAIRRAGDHAVLRARRHRLRLRRALLFRAGGDAARRGLELHLHLRDTGRDLRLDHRLGPHPRIRDGRGDRGGWLVRLYRVAP